MKKQLSLGLALAFLGSNAAFAAQEKAPKSTPEILANGKMKYAETCLACHGPSGDGNGSVGKMLNPKPRDFAHAKFKNGDKVEQIFATITEGLKGTAMGSYKHIAESDRWAIAHYVKTLQRDGKKKGS